MYYLRVYFQNFTMTKLGLVGTKYDYPVTLWWYGLIFSIFPVIYLCIVWLFNCNGSEIAKLGSFCIFVDYLVSVYSIKLKTFVRDIIKPKGYGLSGEISPVHTINI